MALVSDIRMIESGFGQFVAQIRERLARRRVYRQTLAELRGLSERELHDLGLHRSMLTRIALEAAYGK